MQALPNDLQSDEINRIKNFATFVTEAILGLDQAYFDKLLNNRKSTKYSQTQLICRKMIV